MSSQRADSQSILRHLGVVEAERARRAASPELAAKVLAIKHYQHRRFAHTYADLLESSRYAAVARFFMDELYGPQDFSQRDSQFARVVPTLVRLFSQQIVGLVNTLAELHALSETLDSRMGAALPRAAVDAPSYGVAWRAAGSPAERTRQVELTLQIGSALDRLTRNPVVHGSLKLMRKPARAAGLGELQRFLEAGFDTFKAMRGATEFLSLINERETLLVSTLFGAEVTGKAAAGATSLLP